MRTSKRLFLLAALLVCVGCQTTAGPQIDYAQLYNNAQIALAVAEQGLATWELLASVQGRLTSAEIAARRTAWELRIAELRSQLEYLQGKLK